MYICFSCPYTNTILEAIGMVEKFLQVKIYIVWARRCSDLYTQMADNLSKMGPGYMTQLVKAGWGEMGYLSPTLSQYLSSPVRNGNLGLGIIQEIAPYMNASTTLSNLDYISL